jgi:hypothetical protein
MAVIKELSVRIRTCSRAYSTVQRVDLAEAPVAIAFEYGAAGKGQALNLAIGAEFTRDTTAALRDVSKSARPPCESL